MNLLQIAGIIDGMDGLKLLMLLFKGSGAGFLFLCWLLGLREMEAVVLDSYCLWVAWLDRGGKIERPSNNVLTTDHLFLLILKDNGCHSGPCRLLYFRMTRDWTHKEQIIGREYVD